MAFDKMDRLSTRRSILLWAFIALLGWAVASCFVLTLLPGKVTFASECGGIFESVNSTSHAPAKLSHDNTSHIERIGAGADSHAASPR